MIKKIIILRPKESLNFSESCNAGIKNSENEKIFIANDDIIISKNTLERLYENTDDNTITGPDSNCNLGFQTDYAYEVEGVRLIPAMSLDQIKDIIPWIYLLSPNTDKIVERDWLAFFATMFTRKCFEDVGLLDENFVYDREDLSWCLNAQKKNKRFKQIFSSYCFHFGGVSRKVKHKELGLKHDLDQDLNLKYFNAKHGIRKTKEIKDYEDYVVSEDGIVISYKDWRGTSERVLTLKPNEDGYLNVGLFKDNKYNSFLVHRLVAQAFLDNPENKLTVNHKNGIKTDNRVENLEWATQKENVLHAFRTGLSSHACEKNTNSKLTENEVKDIRRIYSQEKVTYKDLANRYNISESMIGNIITKKKLGYREAITCFLLF